MSDEDVQSRAGLDAKGLVVAKVEKFEPGNAHTPIVPRRASCQSVTKRIVSIFTDATRETKKWLLRVLGNFVRCQTFRLREVGDLENTAHRSGAAQ